jgi:hypothetical protein
VTRRAPSFSDSPFSFATVVRWPPKPYAIKSQPSGKIRSIGSIVARKVSLGSWSSAKCVFFLVSFLFKTSFLEKAWQVAAEFLRPRELGSPPNDFSEYMFMLGAHPRACLRFSWSDTHQVRSAFDVLMQCRMLPMLLECFVGAFHNPSRNNSRMKHPSRGYAPQSAFNH